MRRAHERFLWLLGGVAIATQATAQQTTTVRPSITVVPPPDVPEPIPAPPPPPLPSLLGQADAAAGAALQLEVFLNERPLNLISAFTQNADGALASTTPELEEIGLRVPEPLREEPAVPLAGLPGVRYVYEEPTQSIHFTAAPGALKATLLEGHPADPAPAPVRPPPGAILNYTLYASAERTDGSLAFDGLSGAFEARVFGPFGLVESTALVRLGGAGSQLIRLDTAFVHEDPAKLQTLRVGDFVSGGFPWTRPIRMGGVQLRRNFGLRPDLITLPLPTLTGTAAAPSTLDLYVNGVQTFTSDVPQGPFEIAHPPIVYGGGVASVVVRDALGRETVTSNPFYASPDLLAPGLSDFSLELGFARRNFASLSNDYDRRLALSASWRHGLTDSMTVQAHAETVGSLVLLGGGANFTLGDLGIASLAVAGSRTGEGTGALVNAVFESRHPGFTVLLRSQRVFGEYQDLASWTAVQPPSLAHEHHVIGRPRALDQATLSFPTPWRGGALGASYIHAETDDDRSRIFNLSLTQELGRFSLFASAFHDFEQDNSTGIFVGLSIPLGHGVHASTGLSHRGSATNGFVEASRSGHHEPGELGWTLRAAAGERTEGEAILRYGTTFARAEAGALYQGGQVAGHALIEGALTYVGGGFHATQRVDDSFALIETGAAGLSVLYENRPVATTNARGQAVVPHLTPFVANRISVDPTNLPIDAEVRTETTVAPFSRVPAYVDMRVTSLGAAALATFVDAAGTPLPLGSEVRLNGGEEAYVVGYDGAAYLQGLADLNRAQVALPDGSMCSAEFPYQASAGEQVHIRSVVCRPGS